uniref:DNA2/NAM7 helicase-like C-terminal domain-containing protein n=1 Tax=Romanomermis culicivorax TaxID=13658 RepID=A0A915JDM1_ROMCU
MWPISWVNVTSLQWVEDHSPSVQNVQEACPVVKLTASLIGMQKFKNQDIIIITLYSPQFKLLQKTMLDVKP